MKRASSRFISLGSVLLTLGAALILCSCSSVRPSANSHHGLFDSGDRTPAVSSASSKGKTIEISTQALQNARKLMLHWPLKSVQVTSRFGRRPRDFHEGIDLRAKSGTPVYAAQEGKVIYAGKKIRGYGRMLVIKHAYGIATVYAHNSRLLVRAGDHVRLGQQVAVSGSTGHSTGPHLHFEVRSGTVAVDPQQMVSLALVADERSRPARRVASSQ